MAARAVFNRPRRVVLVVLNQVVLLALEQQLPVQLVLQAHHNRGPAHNFCLINQ